MQAGVLVFFIRRGQMLKRQRNAISPAPDANSYEGVRNLALKVTPAQLKLTIPPSETFVYGVVMDWDMGEMITTLAAYITGAASTCFSSGGVVAGGGVNPAVGEAAVDFVTFAQDFVYRAIAVTTTDLPAKGCVRFYFLTNQGIFAAQEQTRHFEDNTSPWLHLFAKGSIVINEIRGSGNDTARDN